VQLKPCPPELRGLEQPEALRDRREPIPRVVGPQAQPELGPAREHAIGLNGRLRDQVVHEHADVRLVPPEHHIRGFRTRETGRVHTRDQALGRGLFVPARPVDLTRKEEPGHTLRLTRRADLVRADHVVLDRVPVPQDLRPLTPGHRVDDLVLHVRGQARADPVAIDPFRTDALRLEEHAVPLAVGEAHDLVLDARAIPRPRALDLPAEQGCSVQVLADQLVRLRCRVRLAAVDLLEHREAPQHGEPRVPLDR
jgi:hypothetical protein